MNKEDIKKYGKRALEVLGMGTVGGLAVGCSDGDDNTDDNNPITGGDSDINANIPADLRDSVDIDQVIATFPNNETNMINPETVIDSVTVGNKTLLPTDTLIETLADSTIVKTPYFTVDTLLNSVNILTKHLDNGDSIPVAIYNGGLVATGDFAHDNPFKRPLSKDNFIYTNIPGTDLTQAQFTDARKVGKTFVTSEGNIVTEDIGNVDTVSQEALKFGNVIYDIKNDRHSFSDTLKADSVIAPTLSDIIAVNDTVITPGQVKAALTGTPLSNWNVNLVKDGGIVQKTNVTLDSLGIDTASFPVADSGNYIFVAGNDTSGLIYAIDTTTIDTIGDTTVVDTGMIDSVKAVQDSVILNKSGATVVDYKAFGKDTTLTGTLSDGQSKAVTPVDTGANVSFNVNQAGKYTFKLGDKESDTVFVYDTTTNKFGVIDTAYLMGTKDTFNLGDTAKYIIGGSDTTVEASVAGQSKIATLAGVDVTDTLEFILTQTGEHTLTAGDKQAQAIYVLEPVNIDKLLPDSAAFDADTGRVGKAVGLTVYNDDSVAVSYVDENSNTHIVESNLKVSKLYDSAGQKIVTSPDGTPLDTITILNSIDGFTSIDTGYAGDTAVVIPNVAGAEATDSIKYTFDDKNIEALANDSVKHVLPDKEGFVYLLADNGAVKDSIYVKNDPVHKMNATERSAIMSDSLDQYLVSLPEGTDLDVATSNGQVTIKNEAGTTIYRVFENMGKPVGQNLGVLALVVTDKDLTDEQIANYKLSDVHVYDSNDAINLEQFNADLAEAKSYIN